MEEAEWVLLPKAAEIVAEKLCGRHKGRPYSHAFGYFVGAGFIPARGSIGDRPLQVPC